jgi:hypothetical protein
MGGLKKSPEPLEKVLTSVWGSSKIGKVLTGSLEDPRPPPLDLVFDIRVGGCLMMN